MALFKPSNKQLNRKDMSWEDEKRTVSGGHLDCEIWCGEAALVRIAILGWW